MSDQIKFFKGSSEAGLPTNYEIGGIYFCEDTGNSYIGESETKTKRFSSAVGKTVLNGSKVGEIFNDYANNSAKGNYSHAEGQGTIATGNHQHVQGKYNIEDTNNSYAHIIGNGNSSTRSNIHTVDWNGNAWFAGNVSVDGSFKGPLDGTAKNATNDENGNNIINTYGTKTEVNAKLPLAGGTMTATAAIKWPEKNSRNPYIGYCSHSSDGTFILGSLDGNKWDTGLCIGGSSGNLLWKGKRILDASNYTDYANKYVHPSYDAVTSKPTGNQAPGFGGTATISQITSDGLGHITGATDRTITIPSTLSDGSGTAGLIKTSSTVTSSSGYTACPVISGVPYYKPYSVATSSVLGLVKSGTDITVDANGNVSVNDNSHNHNASNINAGTLSSDRLPTVPISKGGTGATTTKGASYNLLNDMSESTSDVTDDFPMVFKYSTPTAEKGAIFFKKASHFWTYTQGKINSVLGLTATSYGGNAASATKLATARTVDGVSFDGSANITHYGVCSTAAATAAKTVSLTGFTLATGARVLVKFSVTNTASNPTLNVNSTGAKAIMYRGSAINASYLAASRIQEFVYDGTDWELVGDINTNTTYTFNGAVSTIKDSNLTASRALISDSSGKVAVSAVTSTELGYLDGVTSAIQTQLNGKQATITGAATTVTSSDLTASRALISNSSGKIVVSAVTSTELGYLDGVTSAIQTQLNGKAPSSHNHSGDSLNPASIEFKGSSSHGGYIDFHYGQSTADYTSRIIEDASGKLSITASSGVYINGSKAATASDLAGKSDTGHGHIYLTANTDNRSVNTTPNDYNGVFKISGLKQNASIGLSSGTTYSAVLGIRGWADSSGGDSHELAFNGAGGIWTRSGSTTSWGSWQKIVTSANFSLSGTTLTITI